MTESRLPQSKPVPSNPAWLDRVFWIAILLAAVILIPRAWLIAVHSSPCIDDEYHLDRGLCVLRGERHPERYNDPPLGAAIMALPLWLAGVEPRPVQPPDADVLIWRKRNRSILFDQPLSPDAILQIVALWKAILFIPVVAIAFHWCRRLYGTRSAWLVLTLILFEPTIAAHLSIAALDTFALSGVLVASFFTWRFIERPSVLRLVVAAFLIAVALLLKHTGFLTPLIAVVLIGADAIRKHKPLAHTLRVVAAAAVLVLFSIWTLTGFEVSAPAKSYNLATIQPGETTSAARKVIVKTLNTPLPAGIYIASILEARAHKGFGHASFLWGQRSDRGFPHYYPAVALYKVPIGTWLIVLLAAVSIAWVRPSWPELALIVPMILCATLIVFGRINIGFRHALTAWIFVLMLSGRSVAQSSPRLAVIVAWLAAAATAVHVSFQHPNYLSYLNAPWRNAHQSINDSNLDWGQSLKHVARWIDSRPADGRTIYLDAWENCGGNAIARYVGERVEVLTNEDPLPSDGLLIVSPLWVAGLYDRPGDEARYSHLRDKTPDAIIANSLLVFDLDRSP